MKTLPCSWEDKDFSYQTLYKLNMLRLLEKTSKTGRKSYEVVILQFRKASTANFGGVIVNYEDSEYMPNSNQWGDYGWSYTDFEDAFAKYKSLTNVKK